MKVEFDSRLISATSYTKFLGITIENTLWWKRQIDQLLCKLSAAFYAVSSQTIFSLKKH